MELSYQDREWAWQVAAQHDLNTYELTVLLCLTDHRNSNTKLCCPGIQRIAERCRMGISTARKIIARLRYKGLLDTVQKTFTRYILPIEDAAPTEQETLDTSTERSNGAPDAPIEHHNQNLKPRYKRKKNQPPPSSSEYARARKTGDEEGVQSSLVVSGEEEAEHRLPKGWTFSEEHVQRIESEVRATKMSFLEGLVRKEEGYDAFVREFADLFASEQAAEMRRWATTKGRTSRNWNDRFLEWLRVEFSKAKAEKRSLRVNREGKTVSVRDYHSMQALRRMEAARSSAPPSPYAEREPKDDSPNYAVLASMRVNIKRNERYRTCPKYREEFPDAAKRMDESYNNYVRWTGGPP
jgi:ribosomal protein S25